MCIRDTSYTPDWKTMNLVLTPSLYVIGTTADQIATANVTSVKWYVGEMCIRDSYKGTKRNVESVKDAKNAQVG